MTTDVMIERALATLTATLNDQGDTSYDRARVQDIVDGALGGERKLIADDGGGLHDESGARVAAIRRGAGGDWIAERQNSAAAGSETAVPSGQSDG